jgi:hypothetical protein
VKPIERIAAMTEAARPPVGVVTTNPLGPEPATYTVTAAEFGRLLAAVRDAAWAAAFIERLWNETGEAAEYAKRQRDETYPVHPDRVNHEAGEEPGEPHPWSQGFHEGAAHVRDMLGQLMLTDPDHFGPDDTAFRIPERPLELVTETPRALILEFDPDPESPENR